MILIKLLNIEKSFNKTVVLDDLSLTVHSGKINILLGPSGCGKSTLLNIIGGLDKDYKGCIEDIDNSNLSYVFQEDRLLEWLTVHENILFSLSGKLEESILLDYAKALGLSQYLTHYPNELSGGLRQRVNLLRAFLHPSSLLLMDEPFKSLDIKTKEEVINLFLQIQKERKLTVLLVTHSLEEAMEIGHYIHVLSSKPSRLLKTFTNPLLSSKEPYSSEDKESFLNKIQDLIHIDK